MDPTRKLFARTVFKLRVHEAKGVAFQSLFERVMVYRFPDFIPVKPYGNVGDRKNDGYIRSLGRYFQVFSPENPTSRTTATAAAKKAGQDFLGLKAHWDRTTPVRDYRFVFNDEYRGSSPPLEDALARIRNEHAVEAGVFLAKDLEAEALSLAEDQLLDVIGTPIPEVGLLDSVDFGILREIIRHVLDHQAPFTPEAALKAPDFGEKIKLNGLSAPVASFLTVASYQSEAVKDYFSKNSSFARQELRDRLSALYMASRQRLPSLDGDLIFFDLLEAVTPSLPEASMAQKSAAQNAAAVVMAYYFEACDIFEDPSALT